MVAGAPQADALIAEPPERLAGKRLILGFSGGLDSTALLHALIEAGYAGLEVAHVHHGLQVLADEWAAHCERSCAALNVPMKVLRANVAQGAGAGPEASARQARYRALVALMQPDDVLVTAHHLDDQAETLLLRLLRGTGPQGLGSMRPWSAYPPGYRWRPLLWTPRAQIRRFAERRGLRWIEDPHNADPRYTRSWLRAEVMPQLDQRFPAAASLLARAAALCAQSADLNDELAQIDAHTVSVGAELSIRRLQDLSLPRRHNLQRYWIRSLGLELPSQQILRRIDTEVLGAAADKSPVLKWPGGEVRRYRDRIYAMARLPPKPNPETALTWTHGRTLALPDGCGRLSAACEPPQGVTVRFAHAGESLTPLGGRHRRRLKNLFQEAGMPPWQRQRCPLLFKDGVLIWIGGIGASQQWPEHVQASPWVPVWDPKP